MRKLTITFELTKWIQSDMGKIGLLIELTNVLTMLIYTIDHFWPFESNYRKIICIVRIRGRNTIWKIGSRSKRSNYRKIELKGVELSAVDCIESASQIKWRDFIGCQNKQSLHVSDTWKWLAKRGSGASKTNNQNQFIETRQRYAT